MTKISGIYAATMSVLNPDLSLNVKNTIEHAEKLIDEVVMAQQYLAVQVSPN